MRNEFILNSSFKAVFTGNLIFKKSKKRPKGFGLFEWVIIPTGDKFWWKGDGVLEGIYPI